MLIQKMLTPSILLHLAREKGHQVHDMVLSSAVELMFRETAMFTSPHAKAMARKAAEQIMVQEC